MDSKRGWTLALVMSSVMLAGLAFFTTDSAGTPLLSTPVTLTLSLILILCVPLYVVAWGWRAIVTERGGWASQLILVIVCALLAFLNPNMLTMQVIMYPLLWSTSRTTRQAIGINIFAAVALGLASVVGANDPSWAIAGWATAGASLVFSLGMGLWMTSIHRYGAEKAQLLADLTRQQDTIAALNREAGAVEERARLSRELHDTVAQTLTGIVMLARRAGKQVAASADREATPTDDTLDTIDTLHLIETSAAEALADTRVMVSTMSSSSETGGSLADTLDRLCTRFGRETRAEVQLSITDEVVASLDRAHEVVVLRCVQEGLGNVRKHAAASRVTVTLGGSPAAPVLTIADNGRGVPLGGTSTGGTFGLDGMRDRLALVGGTVTLESPTTGGARLTITLPSPGATP